MRQAQANNAKEQRARQTDLLARNIVDDVSPDVMFECCCIIRSSCLLSTLKLLGQVEASTNDLCFCLLSKRHTCNIFASPVNG